MREKPGVQVFRALGGHEGRGSSSSSSSSWQSAIAFADGQALRTNTLRALPDRRDGLIRARNNLFLTVIGTGLAIYVAFGLAVIRQVDVEMITALSVFFLVGAIVGLFRELRSAAATDTVMEED